MTYKICSSIFLVTLWLPIIAMLLHIKPTYEVPGEKVVLDSSVANTGSLRSRVDYFENYFNNNFGFRDIFLHFHAIGLIRFLHTSPNPEVVLGKDDWLFYNSEAVGDGNTFTDYRGDVPFSDNQLALINQNLSDINKTLLDKGIRFFVTIAPNKNTIYPEYLPYSVGKKGKQTRLDQVIKYLNQNSNVRLIDVRQQLLEEKKNQILYYKTDTHWNNYGAFLFTQILLRSMAQSNLYLQSDIAQNYGMNVEVVNAKGDINNMLLLTNDFKDMNITLKPKVVVNYTYAPYSYQNTNNHFIATTPNDHLPSIVVFRDSFFTSPIPFFSPHFSKAIYLWTPAIDYGIVAKEKPNIVLYEVAERYLDFLTYPPITSSGM